VHLIQQGGRVENSRDDAGCWQSISQCLNVLDTSRNLKKVDTDMKQVASSQSHSELPNLLGRSRHYTKAGTDMNKLK
jgi:hypothetical protein